MGAATGKLLGTPAGLREGRARSAGRALRAASEAAA